MMEQVLVAAAETICLDAGFSTTRRVLPAGDPPAAVLQNEGGLRCQGYRKQGTPEFPLLTVVTVVFNGERHLADTIESVLQLSYPNVEYIVVDGGSRDGTVDVLRRYEHAIDYWVSARDAGIYDAMNKAWTLASADASVLFLGSGDLILSLPEKWTPDAIVYGKVMMGDKAFRSTLRYAMRVGNTLHHQALIIPKRFHPAAPFDLRFNVYADFDFNQRLYRQGYPFVYADGLQAYALPGGVSARLDVAQMMAVTRKNLGLPSALMTLLYCSYQRLRQDVLQAFAARAQ